jgi:hypothetical protein
VQTVNGGLEEAYVNSTYQQRQGISFDCGAAELHQ